MFVNKNVPSLKYIFSLQKTENVKKHGISLSQQTGRSATFHSSSQVKDTGSGTVSCVSAGQVLTVTSCCSTRGSTRLASARTVSDSSSQLVAVTANEVSVSLPHTSTAGVELAESHLGRVGLRRNPPKTQFYKAGESASQSLGSNTGYELSMQARSGSSTESVSCRTKQVTADTSSDLRSLPGSERANSTPDMSRLTMSHLSNDLVSHATCYSTSDSTTHLINESINDSTSQATSGSTGQCTTDLVKNFVLPVTSAHVRPVDDSNSDSTKETSSDPATGADNPLLLKETTVPARFGLRPKPAKTQLYQSGQCGHQQAVGVSRHRDDTDTGHSDTDTRRATMKREAAGQQPMVSGRSKRGRKKLVAVNRHAEQAQQVLTLHEILNILSLHVKHIAA